MASDDYLAVLSPVNAARLAEVNGPGLAAIKHLLAYDAAVAFLGAGVSAPLYPLWDGVVADLIATAAERGLDEDAAETCRALAAAEPDTVVELLSRTMGAAQYQAVLRDVFRVRRDPTTGRTWTPVQELVCRCAFKAVVTTNYDPGVVDARMRVRSRAVGTGFTSWVDEPALERWRTGEVFIGDDELPVLYAHGYHNQPENMVLALSEYRRAYGGKLSDVIVQMVDSWHLVWIGFSFTDERIGAILREVGESSDSGLLPSGDPRHVAVMAWDPERGQEPSVLATRARIRYGAHLVLYPAPGGDHSALGRLLNGFTDPRYPPIANAPEVARGPTPRPVSTGLVTELTKAWVHGAQSPQRFTGRLEELRRLNRWAADPTVGLIGVCAWAGAGKTALVTHWIERDGGLASRPGIRGMFGWSFYTSSNADEWARSLLGWARDTFGLRLNEAAGAAATIVQVLRSVPLVLMLDGLEVVQEGPASDGYGRLLDGLLREVLTTFCLVEQPPSLLVLTSRFPFADLSAFDGGTARMIEVPPLTPAEGSAVLAAAGATRLPDAQRRELVSKVDGHALAVSAIATLLAQSTDPGTPDELIARLGEARPTEKIKRVLGFYADRLSPPHRFLTGAVALFTRPVKPEQILALARHELFARHLRGRDVQWVSDAVRGPLAGLLNQHPDGTVSAHPLVRETFKAIAFGAAPDAVELSLTGTPEGPVSTREQALLVVEAIELLLDADQWDAAHDLYRARANRGEVWKHLPAARLGQRAAIAFVANTDRRRACVARLTGRHLTFYLDEVGLHALASGDITTAREYIETGLRLHRDHGDVVDMCVGLRRRADCLGVLGQTRLAVQAAADALAQATAANRREQIRKAHAFVGWTADIAGDSLTADAHFRTADQLEYAEYGCHLSSLRGARWAWFLARTGRGAHAWGLMTSALAMSEDNDWNEEAARCRVLLARLALAAGQPDLAAEHLPPAVTVLREGDLLVELAEALTVMAEYGRHVGELDQADLHIKEALTIAGPRGLVPSRAAALAEWARIAAVRYESTKDAKHLRRGRDAADNAVRIARSPHPLPWCELDALRAHARLDVAEGQDRAWAEQARDLRATLVPEGLSADPLGPDDGRA